MRATLRAVSARLIVGHLDRDQAADLLSVVEPRGKPLIFALAEPEGLRQAVAVPAGGAGDNFRAEPVRWGKLVLETVADEAIASARPDLCDSIVDGLRVAHRRLGAEGLEMIPRGSSGVGFCAVALIDGAAQIVVVPPAQVFVVHQGVALSVPESDDVGRGIWMRDDLRAEIYAGVGGAHEPDIRIYEATIGPGDSLVLATSSLARMLTEDDVRLAVTYEEAATGAERIKQLALQRGVEAGVAMVIELAGSIAPERAELATQPGETKLPRIEMPPIGSVFSTARDWLLDAVERIQTSPHEHQLARSGAQDEDDGEDVIWPVRPPRGGWRSPTETAPHGAPFAVRQGATDSTRAEEPRVNTASQGTTIAGQGAAAARSSYSARPARQTNAQVGGRDYVPRSHPPRGGRLALPAMPQVGPVLAGIWDHLTTGAADLRNHLGSIDLRRKRPLLAPLLTAAIVLLVVVGAVRTIRAQQARQLQQRYDSLVTAAAQLETQARGEGDRNQAQSLIRRAQALVDQAANLRGDQPQVAGLRKDLQSDLDRLDNILGLPDPTIVGNFNSLGKDVAAAGMVASPGAFFVLDSSGQRVLQLQRDTKQLVPAAAKGDKGGNNQLGAPKLLAIRDNGLLILDANRTLWSYDPSKKSLEQIGLKSSDSWKDATAVAAYGPNVYVLDATLGNIYRYASRDGIFTDAPTRFLQDDNKGLLGSAVSLAIDGSIWVLTSDGQILKMEGGARQPFAISGLPQPMGKAGQLYTDADQRSLYVLDVGNNRVLQIAKDGRYLRQFNLSLPAPATAFYPDEIGHQLYVLAGTTLYQYQLPG